MPSLKFVYLLIFGFATLHSFNVMGEETDLFDTCPIMDPATIQRRICELQVSNFFLNMLFQRYLFSCF